MVSSRQRIYFGDLTDQKPGKKSQLLWKDFDFSDHALNPKTLVPEINEQELDRKFESDIEEENYKELVILSKNFIEESKSKPVSTVKQDKKFQSLVCSANIREKKKKKPSYFKSLVHDLKNDLGKFRNYKNFSYFHY